MVAAGGSEAGIESGKGIFARGENLGGSEVGNAVRTTGDEKAAIVEESGGVITAGSDHVEPERECAGGGIKEFDRSGGAVG